MLIKSGDDRSSTIEELESLLISAAGTQRKRIEEELRFQKAGMRAEHAAAYLLDFDLRDSRNTAVIHDLRIEINDRVAQIDHLLIHRTLTVFVLETKAFHAGLKITEEGEFLRWNDWKKTYEGMPSPLAQNERHIAVLKDAFDKIDMPTRLGVRLSPTFHSAVLIDSNARIDRPKKFDASRVIKADMITDFVQSTLDQQNPMGGLAKLVGSDTLEQIARNLASLHRPSVTDYRAKFGIKEVTEPTEVAELEKSSSIEKPGPQCKACGQGNVTIQYGKYGYYFKCADCGGNTAIHLVCEKGHNERIRKERLAFFRECSQCETSSVFFENSVVDGMRDRHSRLQRTDHGSA